MPAISLCFNVTLSAVQALNALEENVLYMGFLLRQGRKLSDRCGIFAACSAWDGRAADAIHHGRNNPGYFIWTSLRNIMQSVLNFSFPGIVAHS